MTRDVNGVPVETERKFLIEMPDLSELAQMKASDISQTYLTGPNGDERIRKRVYENETVYTHTRKTPISNMSRIELEEEISEDEYKNLLKNADPHMATVHKTRYEIPYNGKCFEVDVYPFEKDRAVMEIELGSEREEFEVPPFIKIIKEVTEDEAFSNKSIAKKLKSDPDSQIIPR